MPSQSARTHSRVSSALADKMAWIVSAALHGIHPEFVMPWLRVPCLTTFECLNFQMQAVFVEEKKGEAKAEAKADAKVVVVDDKKKDDKKDEKVGGLQHGC